MPESKYIFIGAGNMAEAMVRGLIQSGRATGPEILLCDIRTQRLRELAVDLGVKTQAGAAEALKQGGMVVLAVKPQALDTLAEEIRDHLDARRLVVSILAGVRLERLKKSLGGRGLLVRVMPNTPALVGKGASAYCLGEGAGEDQARHVEALLKSFGTVVRVDESQMDAVTALSGSGPAYVFLFMEALQAAGINLGLDPATAFTLAAQTLLGAADMIQKSGETPEALRQKVTSPGGTTQAALQKLEEGGFRQLVADALRAARDRSVELGGKA